MKEEYNNEFYQNRLKLTQISAKKTVPVILNILKENKINPTSIIDLGCGSGTCLKEFSNNKLEILGVDGGKLTKEILEIPMKNFVSYDFETPYSSNEKYDLAMSLEVAEHISENQSDSFIKSLIDLSDIIIFSAAIPFQEGTGHVNMQWPTYWIEKFALNNYKCIDCIREEIWNDDNINVIYRQNIFIFCKETQKNKKLIELSKKNSKKINLVNPKIWEIYRINYQKNNIEYEELNQSHINTLNLLNIKEQEKEELQKQIKDLNNELNKVLNSKSWKLTSPLRRLTNKFKNPYKNRLAVYTVLMGDYDDLKTPNVIDDNCDYYCITNNSELKSDFYKIIYVKNKFKLDNNRFSRYPKILPHKYFKKYDRSLYVDANFLINISVNEFINNFSKGNKMLCFNHPHRNCIYEEALACKELEKDDSKIIDEHIERIKAAGYPKDNGLLSGGILYRLHNDKEVKKVMKDWWKELYKGSRRDQLSFNYVAWKHNFKYDECTLDYFNNEYFIYNNHK